MMLSEELELAVYILIIGIGATLVMDLWAALQKRIFAVPSLNYRMVGRWMGHIFKGRIIHVNIALAAPVRGELVVGWAAHYLIGILFAALLVGLWGLEWIRQPSLTPALIIGISTIIAPFFILQPGMGAGIAASKTPNPNVARFRSLVAHMSFGFGLYGSAMLLAHLIL